MYIDGKHDNDSLSENVIGSFKGTGPDLYHKKVGDFI